MTSASALATFFSPASFQDPEDVTQSGWLEHGPFAAWVVQACRPDLLVELGSHWGYSFFAFCQSIKAAGLPTHCVAVDTWEGDEHAGFYGDDVFQHVKELAERDYPGFTTLKRMRFDEALADFADGSIDLLHIDGRHFYEDALEDFESYLPKVSARGVVLIHDIAEHQEGFGVWRLWEEIAAKYPTFAFEHGHGLGVVAVGADVPEPLRELTSLAPDSPEAAFVRAGYFELGRGISGAFELPRVQELARSSLDEMGALRYALDTEREAHGARIADLEAQLASARGEAAYAGRRAEAVYRQATGRLANLSQRNDVLRASLHRATRPHPASVARIVRNGLRKAGERLLRTGAPDAATVEKLRALFDASDYQRRHPGLHLSPEEAFQHYLTHGWPNDESPSPLIDPVWYLDANEDLRGAGVGPVKHYVQRGWREGRNPTVAFDSAWYRAQHPGEVGADEDALVHFVTRGHDRGYDPNPAFRTKWYLRTYPDVAESGRNALADYVTEGCLRGRDPHPDFDTAWYVTTYLDVAHDDVNPLSHYLRYGVKDGRATNAAGARAGQE